MAYAIIIVASTIVGGLLGAFSAASTGGNILEGAIQGSINGAIGTVCSLLLPYGVIGNAAIATVTSYMADRGIQVASHYIQNGNMDEYEYDEVRSIRNSLQTGVGALVPAINGTQG